MSLLLALIGGGGGTSYSLIANPGSYTLSGGSATLKVGRKITASAGTYSLTGGAASLKVGRKITANAGVYTLTGSSATLTKTAGVTAYSLTALAGSYAITGGSAGLSVGRSLAAGAGVYAITGSPASFTYTPAAPPLQRGDGVDHRWSKKERKAREKKLEDERQRKDEIRQLIARALEPVKDEDKVEVVEVDGGVSVIPSAGKPVAIVQPAGVDVQAILVEVRAILTEYQVQAEQTRRAEAQAIARQAIEAARENVRRAVIRKRRQEELLLLMT